jgi:hypothetical protein
VIFEVEIIFSVGEIDWKRLQNTAGVIDAHFPNLGCIVRPDVLEKSPHLLRKTGQHYAELILGVKDVDRFMEYLAIGAYDSWVDKAPGPVLEIPGYPFIHVKRPWCNKKVFVYHESNFDR